MVCAAFPLANVRQLLRFNVMAVDLRLANTHMLLLSQHDGSTLLVRWLGKSFQAFKTASPLPKSVAAYQFN